MIFRILVKQAVTSKYANTLMCNIITNDIFENKNGAFVSKFEAKITERKITTFPAK